MRRLTLLLAAALLALTFAAVRPGAAQAQDNVVVAVNTKDGTSIINFALKIVRTSQKVVDQSNAAAAVASCVECEAIAAAFQVVLVFSNPDIVTPENLALALNVECTECLAFAAAYQWVLGTGGPVHFSAEGNQQLAELKQRLNELEKNEDLTLDELIAELEEIQAAIAQVLATELVPAGNAGNNAGSGSTDSEEPTATTTEPAPTTTEPEGSTTTTEPVGTTTSP